ncbi:MAG TPA: hypothetical protein VM534_09055 [Thermoanaerobaculia bacterium]|nr:hypothetical protein [Thermoanaerobaculia bacterium]
MILRLLQENRVVAESPMRYAGETSLFEGTIGLPAAGRFELQVIASEPAEANFGMHTITIQVE